MEFFGHETDDAVRGFQARMKLREDGIVGTTTILALDSQIAQKSKPSMPSKPATPPLPMSLEYMVGQAIPPITPDVGAGVWNSKARENSYIALRDAIVSALPHLSVTFGEDAVLHLTHFFKNTGNPLTINLSGMLDQVPSARERYCQEVRQAQKFVESLPPGRHPITSRRVQEGYNRSTENRNWYLATGGYVRWGTGMVEVMEGGGNRSYALDFTYHVFDRYNWDGGKEVKIFGITITDEFMAEFHRQGLAREFDSWGQCRRFYSWLQGETLRIRSLTPPNSPPATRVFHEKHRPFRNSGGVRARVLS